MKKSSISPDFIVTLPPPTPNGGLHVGHMAGPFLAADIFTKAAQANGDLVHVMSFSDTNQSYVRATAEKQNRDPAELASYWTKDILRALKMFGCQVDNYFEPNEVSNGFVLDTVLSLYKKGTLKKKPYPFMYSPDKDTFLDEAGASGLCPKCLDDCKCGICEACGFPTRADTLINPRATNDPSARIEVRYVDVLVLELENWRNQVRKFHNFNDAIRPKYRWLVDDALGDSLSDFPITVPGTWGIKTGHPDLLGQVINAWAEVALNFVYGYQKVITSDAPTPKIVNFFGYDNSYFYALVHVAFLCAAGMEEFLPYSTIINEFYNLGNAKFSTSRGHVIWASDIAQEYPSDLVRFYAALSAPGFEQGNFNAQNMMEVMKHRLIDPYKRIAMATNTRSLGSVEQTILTERFDQATTTRIASSFDLRRFNLRQGAEDALKSLNAIESSLITCNLDRTSLVKMLNTWALSIAPLMPSVANNLLDSLGIGEVPTDLSMTIDIGDTLQDRQIDDV